MFVMTAPHSTLHGIVLACSLWLLWLLLLLLLTLLAPKTLNEFNIHTGYTALSSLHHTPGG